jgi:glycosyltransferase involved in cell wall biosynthesis
MLSMPRKRRPIVVYCAHGWAFLQDTRPTKRWVYAALERLLTPLADGVVHISQHEARSAAERGIVPAAQVTIYNGLPDKAYPVKVAASARKGSWYSCLRAGRDRQKGLDILFDALKLVKRRDIVLHVVGDAVISEAVVPIPAGDDRIVSHGWVSPEEMEALYSQADVVVMPSRWEGFGYVALEAMRAGCAVFASRRGALPELVVDDVTGRLFDPQRPQNWRGLSTGPRSAT